LASWPHGDPNALARAILAEPAYRPRPAPSASPIQMFLDWLGSLLKPLGEWFSHATGGSGSQVAFVLGAFVIAGVVVGLAYAIVRILDAWSDPRARVRTPRDARAGDLASARPSGEWRALAEAAAARGEYAFAIAALFSAALAALDERAVVPFDPARTPGEYRRLVRRAAADAARPFDALSETFLRAAFGEEAVGDDDYARSLRAFDAMLPAAA
jgi:hypothetical protein